LYKVHPGNFAISVGIVPDKLLLLKTLFFGKKWNERIQDWFL